MAEFDKGQTLLDLQASSLYSQKGKYFVALSNAEFDDDYIVCFVMNTERRMNKSHVDCNREYQKYIIKPNTFTFIKDYTSIMLAQPCCYQLIEMYNDNIRILDKADETLCRQIKNCIDRNYIQVKFVNLIKASF